jgi:RimJ/RimL family protein N-acetyltransferase
VLLRAFHEDEFPVIVARELETGEPSTDVADRRERLTERLRSSGGWLTDELRLAIEADGRLVGDLQARRSSWTLPPWVTELGIAVFPDVQGRGIGTDALRTLCRYLFDEEGFLRVQLSTDVDNAAMRRSAEKAGFTCEGVLRGFWPEADGVRDYAMYGRTRADHEAG